MKFQAEVLAYRDSSYSGAKGRVNQETLTCLDRDPDAKITDTIDVVFESGVVPKASEMVGKLLTFIIDGVRGQTGMRVRFTCKGLAKGA